MSYVTGLGKTLLSRTSENWQQEAYCTDLVEIFPAQLPGVVYGADGSRRRAQLSLLA
ncbi:hypothetical protein ACT691_17410 [Vibrio metschnikovii]